MKICFYQALGVSQGGVIVGEVGEIHTCDEGFA